MSINLETPVLYALNKDGSFQEWKVYTEGAEVVVEFGKKGGKIQQKRTICEMKNVGRSNETTADFQAQLEARSKWEKQVRLGYRETTDQLQEEETFTPMLAHDYLKRGSAVVLPCYTQPKLDGCFTYATKIMTDRGLLEIGKIVDNKLNVSVLTYNETEGVCEYKKVTNYFNNGQRMKSDWLKIGNNGITKNHKVLSKYGWKEYALSKEMLSPNPRYIGILCGMLLGDSVAAIEKRWCKKGGPASWRLRYSVGVKDMEYGKNKSRLLSNVEYHEMGYISGYEKECTSFTSTSLTNSTFPLDIFYDVDRSSANFGKRRKDIDRKLLEHIFTDESLSIWYFDDGSLHYNNGNKDSPRIFLSVARYSEETVANFVTLFRNKYRVQPSVGHYGKDVRLSFTTKDSLYLLWKISSCMGGALERKIPAGFVLASLPPQKEMTYIETDLRKYSTPKGSLCAYDIEVDGNHNYFANNKLVHNCRALMTIKDGVPVFNSRGNKTYPVQGQLIKQMNDLYARSGFDKIDGEIYIHGLSLQKIGALVKKWRTQEMIAKEIQKDYEADIKRRDKAIASGEKVYKNFDGDPVSINVVPEPDVDRYDGYCSNDLQFHIFDIPVNNDSPWYDPDKQVHCRMADLVSVNDIVDEEQYSHLRVVLGGMHDTIKEVEESVGIHMQSGFEGTIIRNFKGRYEYGQRSSDLQKWKIFQTAEAEVLDSNEDKNGEGVLDCIEKDGTQFSCKMKGTHSQRIHAKMLKLVGKFITFSFQARTDKGVPQFPVGICVRDVNTTTWEPIY